MARSKNFVNFVRTGQSLKLERGEGENREMGEESENGERGTGNGKRETGNGKGKRETGREETLTWAVAKGGNLNNAKSQSFGRSASNRCPVIICRPLWDNSVERQDYLACDWRAGNLN